MSVITTLRQALEKIFIQTGDTLENLQFMIVAKEKETYEQSVERLLNQEIDFDKYGSEYIHFTAFSDNFIYWMNEYDGRAYIDLCTRNPIGLIKTYSIDFIVQKDGNWIKDFKPYIKNENPKNEFEKALENYKKYIIDTYVNPSIDRIKALYPKALFEIDEGNEYSIKIVVDVYNIDESIKFFKEITNINIEVLWPNDITCITFIPHSIENTNLYYS